MKTKKQIKQRKFIGLFMASLLSFSHAFAQQLPIKPTRTISFTTTEGTNMDVDISPDGKTILFDILGELYSLPSSGGKATQLTRGIATNLRPVWSPDGKKIAYLSDASGSFHLHIRDLQGSFDHVLGASDEQLDIYRAPIWTADGNYINVATPAMGISVSYGIAGGKLPPPKNVKQPVLHVSADANDLYYLDNYLLYHFDQLKHVKTLVSPTKKQSFYNQGVLSPDGKQWAYVADSNQYKCLIVKDLANHTERVLVRALANHYDYIFWKQPHFSYSKDGNFIFIAYKGKIHRIDEITGADRIIPFLANVKSDLGPLDYHTFRVATDKTEVKYTRSAAISPDNKHVVFSALNRVYIMDLPNGKSRILAPQAVSQYQPTYSQDGKWVAYVSWCDTIGGALWRVPASGGKPEQLTSAPGQYQRPVWSPNGKQLAVIIGEPKLGDRDGIEKGKLVMVSSEGGPLRTVADTIPLTNQLAFTPEGEKIIYEPQQQFDPTGTKKQAYIVCKDIQSKELRVIATAATKGMIYNLQQRSLSPNGKFIVFSMCEDLYLVPVSQQTEPTVIYSTDPQDNLQVIRFAKGVDPKWSTDGKTLGWSYGNKFYQINPGRIIALAARLNQKSDNGFITVDAKPDRIIDLKVCASYLRSQGIIAIRNARIITMQGNKIIEHGTIVINNGRIASVGNVKSTIIPRGAKIYDLDGKTVIPGLVDLHLHLRLAPDIFPQQSWEYLASLAYGVTTARDPSSTYDSFGYRDLLEAGQMTGPRLFSSGRPVRLHEGIVRLESLKDAESIVDKRKTMGGVWMKQYTMPNRIQHEWLLQASAAARMNMTNEGDYFYNQIGMLKDGSTGVEHNPASWGDVYKDVILLWAKSGTYFTPTLQVAPSNGDYQPREYFNHKYWYGSQPKLAHFFPPKDFTYITNGKLTDTTSEEFIDAARIDARISHAGGKVAMGSHGNDKGAGPHNEIWALQMGGLTNLQALQAATITGAQALGVQRDLGSIEVGKIADLIILNKNPLEDIHNTREIKYVMKDGVLYDGDTLDELWPVYKKCPEWRLKTNTTTVK